MRREWGQRKWEEETSCPAAGTGSPRQGRPHGTATPSFSKTQAKGPTVLTNRPEGEAGAAELGGEQPEETGVSRKRVGESSSWTGSSNWWAGYVGGQALALPPSQLISLL